MIKSFCISATIAPFVVPHAIESINKREQSSDGRGDKYCEETLGIPRCIILLKE